MRLDRFIGYRAGKFSIIENHKGGKVTHIGDPTDDFIVIKLKDRNATAALLAYALSAHETDPELAIDFIKLATIARNYPNRRDPD